MSRRKVITVFLFLFWANMTAYARDPNRSPYIKHYGTDCGFNSPGINCIDQDEDGFIWIGSNTGLTRFDGCHFKTFSLVGMDESAFNKQPRCMLVNDREVLVGTMRGLYAFDMESETFACINDSLPALTKSVRGLWNDNGCTMLTDGDSVFRLYRNPTRIVPLRKEEAHEQLDKHYYNERDLTNGIDWGEYRNAVTVSMRDREGGIWAGTFYDGLYYYSDRLQMFSQVRSVGVRPDVVRTICVAETGTVYVGSEDEGVFVFDGASHCLRPLEGMSWDGVPMPKEVHSLVADGDTLWIGTLSDGIYMYDMRKGVVVDNITGDGTRGLHSNHAVQMFRTVERHVIIGTIDGLYVYDRETRRCMMVRGTEGRFVHSIAQSADGQVWVGSLGSPMCNIRKSNGKWEATDSPEFDYPCVTAMSVLRDGSILVGTDNNGLWQIKCSNKGVPKDICTNIIGYSRLGSSVNHIMEDDAGRLWITTFNGLFCYDLSNGRLAHFTSDDGLKTNHFNYASGHIGPDGMALVGSYDGLTAFYPAAFTFMDKPLEPVFTNINIGGTDTLPLKMLTLNYDTPSFYVEYSVPTYAYSNMVYYRYKLEGASDVEWTMTNDDDQRIFFGHLSDGQYRLHLQASYNPNRWEGETALMDIIIRPPFWCSDWAYMLYILVIVVVLAVSFIMWKQRSERNALKKQIAKLLENREYLRSTKASSPYAMAKEVVPEKIESSFLERVDTYLGENICNKNMSVETLAEHMNMSGSTLYRKMKSASSLSPNDYIRLYRLNTAARMLDDGCQIKIVVENVGFSSVSYFTSSFVKHFGITPGEYRNKSIKLK